MPDAFGADVRVGGCQGVSGVAGAKGVCGGVQAGCTALQRAAAEGHLDLVKQLIKHKADVNLQDNGVSSGRWQVQCTSAVCSNFTLPCV